MQPTLAPGAPAWRHGLFIAINLAVVAGLLWRPPGFVLFFAALTAQQIYSHGSDLWLSWRVEHQVDWMSVAVLLVMPATLVALLEAEKPSSAHR